MSKRYWGAVVAIGCLIASLGLAQEPQGAPPNSPSVEEQPNWSANRANGKHAVAPFPVEIVESQDNAQHSRDSEQRAEQHDTDDLKAQRQAADAADRSAAAAERQEVPAWVQMFAAIVGTVALIYSLYLNRKATAAAVIAANAAKDAIGLERAWMAHGDIRIGFVRNSNVDGRPVINGLVFIIPFYNVGRSPAINLSIKNDFKFVDKQNTDVPEFDVKLAVIDGVGDVVAQNSPTAIRVFLNDQQTSDIIESRKRLIIYVKVVYCDVFVKMKEPRHSEICIEAISRGGVLTVGDSTMPAIDFIAIGRQNTVS